MFSLAESGMLQVPAGGGIPKAITDLDSDQGETGHYWMDLLPGDNAVLFTVWSGELDTARIAVQSLETGERWILLEGTNPRYAPTGHVVFARENSLWAVPFDLDRLEVTGSAVPILDGVQVNDGGWAQFALTDNGSLAYRYGRRSESTLVWVERQGGEEQLAVEPRRYSRPRISPDGSRLAIAVDERVNPDVWIYDLAGETFTRLTFDSATDSFPLWTPDGQRVVFQSDRDGGPLNLFWKAADGMGRVERLTTSPNNQEPSFFSSDSKSLVFWEGNPETSWDIGVLSMDGEPASKLLLQTQFNEGRPVISPDGRWVAYMSDEMGRFEVYVRPFPNVEEGRWQISSEGGVSPLWGPKGLELFYRSLDGLKMIVVRIKTEPTFSAGRPETLFTEDYFAMDRAQGYPINSLSSLGRNYDMSPDGQRFLMLKRGEEQLEQEPIYIILNWFEELKRLVPTN